MKKVIIDIDTIHFVHIKEVLLELDKIEIKKDNLSLFTYTYDTYAIVYQAWHNKSSIKLTSHERII